MGKFLCGMKGGFESPAFGSWALGITCQAVAALLLLLLLSGNTVPQKGAEENQLQFADRSTFVALAATHVVCAMVVGILAILGYITSSCFLCPLGILSIGVQAALLTTCGICGSLLSSSVLLAESAMDAARAGMPALVPTLSQTFVIQHQGSLLMICVFCLVAVVPFSGGVSLDVGASAYEAIQYTGSLALMIASASVFLFVRAVPALAGLATAWICVAVGTGIASVIQKRCCSRVLAVALSAVFFVSALFGIASMSAICALFMEGKKLYFRLLESNSKHHIDFVPGSAALRTLTDTEYASYKAFALSHNGAYMVLAICFNMAATVYTTSSGLNCLRTVCGCRRKADKEKDDASEVA